MGEQLYEWYDLHPGLMGATAPLPKHIRSAGALLVGRRTTATEAVAEIQKAAGDDFTIEFSDKPDFLDGTVKPMLFVNYGSVPWGSVNLPKHSWRLLFGRPIGTASPARAAREERGE